jgi:hypothetical protein
LDYSVVKNSCVDNNSTKEEGQEDNLLSVCKTPAEKARLLKLIQIFIEIDQTLKKKNHANN